MIRIPLFFLFFLLGCQESWSYKNQNRFINQCIEENIALGYNSLEYHEFCNCLLNNILNSKLSYNQFLNQELNKQELDQILNSCID
tara:strand:+ start:1894 stop:2151 length:258 start_codon:yes stop_codon:yes gene_type:complete